MDAADLHIFSVPRLRAFEWPPRGSLQYMRNWTLDKGIATLETRTIMQGRRLEPPPLSPMSEPAQARDHPISPSTTRSATPALRSSDTPLTEYSNELESGMQVSPNTTFASLKRLGRSKEIANLAPENSIAVLKYGRKDRRDTHPPNKCFHCGLFCWKCVEDVQKQLQSSRMGCGHPFSPLALSTAERPGRVDLVSPP